LELGKIRGGIRRSRDPSADGLKDTSTLPAYGSGNQLKVGETAEVLLVECGQHRGFGFLGQSDKIGVHDFDVVRAVNLDTPRSHPRLQRCHARSLEEGLE